MEIIWTCWNTQHFAAQRASRRFDVDFSTLFRRFFDAEKTPRWNTQRRLTSNSKFQRRFDVETALKNVRIFRRFDVARWVANDHMRYLGRWYTKFYERYTIKRMTFVCFFNIAAIHCQIHDFLCPGCAWKTNKQKTKQPNKQPNKQTNQSTGVIIVTCSGETRNKSRGRCFWFYL